MILKASIAANDYNFGAQMTERSSCFLAHKFRLNRQSFTCKNYENEFRRRLRVFWEQLLRLYVCYGSKLGSHFACNLCKSLGSLRGEYPEFE